MSWTSDEGHALARSIKRKRIIIRDEVLEAQQRARNGVLIRAIREGKISAVEEAVERGAKVNSTDRNGRTPLHVASASPDTSVGIIALLLELGADINALDSMRHTALDLAVSINASEKIQLLERLGAARSEKLSEEIDTIR